MSAAPWLPFAKPRDTVEMPTGRLGMVVAVLPEGRREIHYLGSTTDTVILKASMLKVRVIVTPRPWQKKIKL